MKLLEKKWIWSTMKECLHSVFCFISLMNLTKRNIKQLSDISIFIHATSISNIK